jgi:predicted nucleotidyltransferase
MMIEEVLPDNLVEMKLFGSRARGDARKDSNLYRVVTGVWVMWFMV